MLFVIIAIVAIISLVVFADRMAQREHQLELMKLEKEKEKKEP